MKLNNARKCKCIKNYYYDSELLYEANDKFHEYGINTNDTIYIKYGDEGYCMFSKNIDDENTEYFNEYFLDINEERVKKLKKLNQI